MNTLPQLLAKQVPLVSMTLLRASVVALPRAFFGADDIRQRKPMFEPKTLSEEQKK